MFNQEVFMSIDLIRRRRERIERFAGQLLEPGFLTRWWPVMAVVAIVVTLAQLPPQSAETQAARWRLSC